MREKKTAIILTVFGVPGLGKTRMCCEGAFIYKRLGKELIERPLQLTNYGRTAGVNVHRGDERLSEKSTFEEWKKKR